MPQNKEAEAFLERVKALPPGPGVSLDAVLQPSIDDETELRRYFASDRGNARLTNPYVGLVDVFDAPADIRATRARVIKDDEDLIAKHIMPVPAEARKSDGAPCMVENLEEFKKNWGVFTEGSLSQLFDWSNVVAAGGSVLACLTPLSEEHKVSKRAIRKYYHSAAYPTSDVDLFLYGMTPEQAEAKIIQIYEAVRDSVPWDVTCIRTKHTVSIHSQYPYRSIQIVLRLYHSPAEILAGFDVDAPCIAYDGSRIWANPRSIVAMMRQANTVDMTRRSPSYEVRLTKYANRGFEVYVPSLDREKIDPTIYERAINKMEGLARLLVFEKLMDGDARYAFLESRRMLRGRPNPLSRYRRDKRQYKGDLKEENPIGGLQMNDYDVATLHIPYGPGWDARRIDKLVYQTDLGMNSTYNPKNKGRRLHRHPAFFGTMQECLEDCCEHCPEPIDDDERELMAEEDDHYIVGRIKFIEENPGRQTMTGSFNPIDVGEWSEQVYVKDTEKFFEAVARNDVEAVKERIKAEIDLNHRDHVGRTCLHLAILSNAPEVALELIEAGARVSARLADGRSALHLAARFDKRDVVKKLLERSAANAELVEKEEEEEDADAMDEDKKAAKEKVSSEDDWSSHPSDGEDVHMKDGDADDEDDEDDDDEDDEDDDEGSDEGSKKHAKSAAEEPPASAAGDEGMPEDDEDEPDILDINEPDWDFGFSPLAYAILYASLEMVDLLLESGADANKPTSTNHNDAKQLHPLDITVLRAEEREVEEDVACAIAERLIKGGASSSRSDDQMYTIFHDMVASGQRKLVATVLRCDPNAQVVIDSPAIRHNEVIFPLVTAVQAADYAMVALLVAHGVKTVLSEEDITRVVESRPPKERSNLFGWGVKSPIDQTFTPLETAIRANDDIAQMLLSFGASYNIAIKRARTYWNNPSDRRTLKDWVDVAILKINERLEKEEKEETEDKKSDLTSPPEVVHTGWKEHLQGLRKSLEGEKKEKEVDEDEVALQKHNKAKKLASLKNVKAYLLDMQRLLDARSARSWKELYPDIETNLSLEPEKPPIKYTESAIEKEVNSDYLYLTNSYRGSYVPMSMNKLYDELFEACFAGDDDKVKRLCLPSESGDAEETRLLNVNVQIGDKDNIYYSSGWTPLFAACAGGHWSTAKLIVAISAAQYSPDDEDEPKVSFRNINLDDDSDSDDSYDSDASEATVGKKKEVQFVDIAKAPTTVRSDIQPKEMISKCTFRFRDGDEVRTGNLLTEAIYSKDVSRFKNIVLLYQSLSKPISIGNQLATILSVDCPEILDEYIRRSGYGLDFEVAKKATEHLPPIVNDDNREYLGLNVHGKKRADLARKNDPNAGYGGGSHTIPLVWTAAKAGATKTIEYLASDKPIAAFQHYATAGSGTRAEQLRRIPDLEKNLPVWLGWTTNSLGESPLTAAIVGNSLKAIKTLFSVKSQFMKATLHQTIKFVGFNAISLAAHTSADTEILDYLLAKSISPAVHDTTRGYNVLHQVCSNRDLKRLRYWLEKLPRDVSQELLKRQSKGALKTPLHIAVGQGGIELVKVILKFDETTALYRNINGQTPLHCAVAKGFHLIAEELLKTPQRGGLYLEDCIGQTPFELAALKELLSRLNISHRHSIQTLAPDEFNENERISVDYVQSQLPILRMVIRENLDQVTLKDPQKFSFEMTAFANTLESNLEQWKQKLAALPPKPEPKVEVDENPRECENVDATWNAIHAALVSAGIAGETDRELAKLLDVQLSVKSLLNEVSKKKKDTKPYDSDAEEDPEEVEMNQCMFSIPRSPPDSS